MALVNTECPNLKLIARGKVRDIYDVSDDALLFVATDRLSAFDVVMLNGVPGKGKILTQLSLFWFKLLEKEGLGPHHLITSDLYKMPASVLEYKDQLEGRSMLVRKLKVLPVEAIVRGYVVGSGWKDYQATGEICGHKLEEGLVNCSKLPSPIFTPSTKAEYGNHDMNISVSKCAEILGEDVAREMERRSIEIYMTAATYAASKGIILADTKMEWGVDEKGNLILVDEVLTPDCCRYWPVDKYEAGRNQDSFDKQYVRNWLEDIKFDKVNPIIIPDDVVARTVDKYVECYELITETSPAL